MAGSDGWVALCERMPTEQDADSQKCVLVWHELSGAMIYHISRLHANSYVTHWMRLPGRPQGAKEPTVE